MANFITSVGVKMGPLHLVVKNHSHTHTNGIISKGYRSQLKPDDLPMVKDLNNLNIKINKVVLNYNAT